MVKIKEAIVVEGKYDKNTLSQIVDTAIFQTDGFGVMNDKPLMDMLRRIAAKRGLIVFTDSDGAGFVIRNRLKSAIPQAQLKHAYIPDIPGKEKRKSAPGKEGKLGVEGMTPQVILDSLRKAGATFCGENELLPCGDLTKADFVDLGLSGAPESSVLRRKLLRYLQLPEHMSSNAMLQALNVLYTKEELGQIVKSISMER